MFVCIALIIFLSSFLPLEKARETWLWPTADAQLAKTGYHTRLIHFVQYFMEESVCMVSEGHVEPVDE